MKDEYDFSKGVRGAVVDSNGKTRITIFLDDDVLAGFRSVLHKAERVIRRLSMKHCAIVYPLSLLR